MAYVSYLEHFSFAKKNKSLYLSVNVFSTAVLSETVNSETNITNQTETC